MWPRPPVFRRQRDHDRVRHAARAADAAWCRQLERGADRSAVDRPLGTCAWGASSRRFIHAVGLMASPRLKRFVGTGLSPPEAAIDAGCHPAESESSGIETSAHDPCSHHRRLQAGGVNAQRASHHHDRHPAHWSCAPQTDSPASHTWPALAAPGHRAWRYCTNTLPLHTVAQQVSARPNPL